MGDFRHERTNHYMSTLQGRDKAYRILAAPLIQATRKKVVEREREVARRESAIAAQRAELARAVELAEQQLTTKLKTEREIAAEEAKKAQLSELESKSQEVAHLQRELQERETKLAEAKNVEAELIRKQGELEDEKRQLDLQIETRVQKSLSDIRHKAKQEAEDAKAQHNGERGANCLHAAPVRGFRADISVPDRPTFSSANSSHCRKVFHYANRPRKGTKDNRDWERWTLAAAAVNPPRSTTARYVSSQSISTHAIVPVVSLARPRGTP